MQTRSATRTQPPSSPEADPPPPHLTLDDVTCPVCLLFVVGPILLPCTHFVCSGCWYRIQGSNNNWRDACPLCRTVATESSVHTEMLNSLVLGKCGELVRMGDMRSLHARDCHDCGVVVFTSNDTDAAAAEDNLPR